MFKVFRKLFYFLKNITIYILAGTGDWIGSVVFYGRPKRLKQIRRFFKQQSNRYIAFIDKKKEWQRVAKKRYKKLITYLDTFPRFEKIHYFVASVWEQRNQAFAPFTFFFLLIHLAKSFYYEVFLLVSDWVKYNDLLNIIYTKIKAVAFFNNMLQIKKIYASSALVHFAPTFLSRRLGIIKRYFFVHQSFEKPKQIDSSSILFLRSINLSAYWSGRLNWFNLINKQINYFLILIDLIMMSLVLYFLWFFWTNHLFFYGVHIGFAISFICSYLFFDTIDKPDLNLLYATQQHSIVAQPIQYYNFSFLSEPDIVSKSFLQICDSILANLSIYVNHSLILLYLLHFIFFFLSFNQLRNMLLLYSQMYLESNFQVPLFFQITTVYNINPYETNYYQAFLNHIVTRKRFTKRTQKVFFQLRTTIKTDLFSHPRLFLKYKAGQLILLRHNQYLFVSNIIYCFLFLFFFYFIPLITCISLWSIVLFGHWVVLQNLAYADFFYIDQLRPKIKMLNYQPQELSTFQKLDDLNSVYLSFYQKYLEKKIQFVQPYLFGQHELDRQYWGISGTRFLEYLKTKYFFLSIAKFLQKVARSAKWRDLKLFVIKIFLFFMIFICRLLILALKISSNMLCRRIRRKLNRYAEWATAENVLQYYEQTVLYFEEIILKDGIGGFFVWIKNKIKFYFYTYVFATISYLYQLRYMRRNFLLRKRLQKECNLYAPARTLRYKNFQDPLKQNWAWHTDIIADKFGIFYKIIKIEAGKIYGVELKFLDTEFEKSYYYGRRIFNWSYTTFLDNFPLFEPRIFWFEFFVSPEHRDIRKRVMRKLKLREAFLVSKGLMKQKTFTENLINAVLDFQLVWNIYALYTFSKEETEAHQVFHSDEPLFEELYAFKDALGPETFEEWDIDNNAIVALDEEEQFQPYHHWVDDLGVLFFNNGDKEFCDFFEFQKDEIDEVEFDRRHNQEDESGITNEDQEEGEADDKPVPYYLTNHDEDEGNEDDYYEYAGAWVSTGDDFIDSDLAPDDVLDYYGQIKQTIDYWGQFHSVMIVHFLVCLCSILSMLLYYFYQDPKQVFFFFFDISDFFYFDFLGWILSSSRRSRHSTIYALSVVDYMQFIAPQVDNIFGTGKTNIYGVIIQQILDQTLELQMFGNNKILGNNLAWGDIFTEQLPFNQKHYEIVRWRKERYFKQKKFRKKLWFVYNDIARLYFYLYYFSMMRVVLDLMLVTENFFYKYWVICLYLYNCPYSSLSIFFFVKFYMTYFSIFFKPLYLVFLSFYLYLLHKLFNEIFKD
jgi:hypothetical protein